MFRGLAGVSGFLLSTVSASVALSAPAHAQVSAYNIKPGALKTALDLWARQSNQQVIYRADEIRGLMSPGARGPLSPRSALHAILTGTGLSVRADQTGAL